MYIHSIYNILYYVASRAEVVEVEVLHEAGVAPASEVLRMVLLVCICISVYIYIYIYIYHYICISVYLYICISVYLYICILCVYVYMYICISVYMYILYIYIYNVCICVFRRGFVLRMLESIGEVHGSRRKCWTFEESQGK